MAKRCALTGRVPSYGCNVSFSKRHTRRRWEPNLQYHRIWVAEVQRFVRLRRSAAGLRKIQKKGLQAALRERGLRLEDVGR
jgi:large subunit ribosomal protein L28